MSKTIDMIRQEHKDMDRLIALLEENLEVFTRGEDPDYDLMREAVDYLTNYPDMLHHPTEDIIFARLKARDPKAATFRELPDLKEEHGELASLTRKFAHTLNVVLMEKEVEREQLQKSARDYIEHFRKHMSKEERTFLPEAEAALDDTDWRAIEQQVGEMTSSLKAGETDRYRKLCRDIIASAE